MKTTDCFSNIKIKINFRPLHLVNKKQSEKILKEILKLKKKINVIKFEHMT